MILTGPGTGASTDRGKWREGGSSCHIQEIDTEEYRNIIESKLSLINEWDSFFISLKSHYISCGPVS
jgi:hypothetical protein